MDDELIKQLRREYWGFQAARKSDLEHLGVSREKDCTFYQFLLSRGFNRFQLSHLGISKDAQA